MTLGILNRGNTQGFHEFYTLIFANNNNFVKKTSQFFPYGSPFFYLAKLDNKLKANKANPTLFFHK